MTRDIEQSMFPELRAHKAVGPLVPSVVAGTNADLVAAIAPLYLTGSVLDVTYGKGGWWKRWQPSPERFRYHDIAVDGVDFTALPYADRSWSTVCYDPPYIPAGGPGNAGDFQERYGIGGGRCQQTLDALVFAGLAEAARVTRVHLLVKCMDYVNGGAFTPMTYRVVDHAQRIGLTLHDEIVHHAGSGPGGHNIVNQLRARRHHSKLLVFTHERIYS